MPAPPRHEFASDNTAGICPEAERALLEANNAAETSYAADRWTRRLGEQLREIFEIDCEAFVVFNGTAANALALAQICRPFESAICHYRAHIHTDECGAPEFFSGGGKLLTVRGERGKLDLEAVAEVLAQHLDVHSTKVRALSVTQATEAGTVYSLAELETIDAIDREIGFWQTKANAILMESAPELLEALKKTVSVIEGMNYYAVEIAAAEEFRSVIARAEGEASS